MCGFYKTLNNLEKHRNDVEIEWNAYFNEICIYQTLNKKHKQISTFPQFVRSSWMLRAFIRLVNGISSTTFQILCKTDRTHTQFEWAEFFIETEGRKTLVFYTTKMALEFINTKKKAIFLHRHKVFSHFSSVEMTEQMKSLLTTRKKMINDFSK